MRSTQAPPASDTVPFRRIVAVAAPNLVPLAGIFFFGWSAPNLLILYSLDTILSIGATAALGGIYGHASEDGSVPAALRGRSAWASGIVAMFIVALMIAIPFGGWTLLLLAPFGWDARDALADPVFVRGVLIQIALALVAFIHGYRALAGRDGADRLLKQRKVFILARYVVTLLAGIGGLELFVLLPQPLGGKLQGFLLVGVYLGSSTIFELSPGFLSAFDRAIGGSSERAPMASRRSFARSEPASADRSPGPIVVVIGFVIGALLAAWSVRELWNGAPGGRVVPIVLLAVGLWFLYRVARLLGARGR